MEKATIAVRSSEMKILQLAIIAILLFPMGINGISYGQDTASSPPMLTVWTDKPDYVTNDTVTVAGYIDKSQTRIVHSLDITVSNPDGQWYRQDQFPVDNNGRFSYQFKIKGNLTVSGHYLVRVWSLEDLGMDVGTSFNVDSTISSSVPTILVKQGSTEISYSGDNMTESIEYNITVQPRALGALYVDIIKNSHLLRTDTLGTPYLTSFGEGGKQYYYNLTISGKKDQDIYKIDFRYGGKTEEKTIPLTMSANGIMATNSIQSPLKQIRSGIGPHEIQCGYDLQLVIKSEDGTPACVNPDSIDRLYQRGWTGETSNPRDTYMDIKVYDSYTPRSLNGNFLLGTLYSLKGTMPYSNVTVSVNGTVMGAARTLPGGCFQFKDWNDAKIEDKINRTAEMDRQGFLHGSAYLDFEAHYMGDSSHDPTTASASSYLYFYALPLPPPNYDTRVYPSDQLNVTQGGSVPFHIAVKPFSQYWAVEHMKLNFQRVPCGISYSIVPVGSNDSALENSTASFDVLLNTADDTPPGKYWISINQDVGEAEKLHTSTDVGAFILNVLGN